MKYVKNLGLLAVATAALMAFATSASADYVTTTTGGAASTPTLHVTNEGGHISLTTSSGLVACASTVEFPIVDHGPGQPVDGVVTRLTFTNCTNGWTVEVNANGSLSVSSTSGHNGTLSSTGATITAIRHTIFGTLECRYSTNATHIGTVTGGNPATLKIEGNVPFHSGGGLCGSGSSLWTGNYVTTSAVYVGKS